MKSPPPDPRQDPAGTPQSALMSPAGPPPDPLSLDFTSEAAAIELSVWQHPFVQNVLPFLTSLILHVAVIVMGLLTMKVVQVVVTNPARDQIIIPDAEMVADGPPGGLEHPGLGGDPTRDAAQNLVPDVPKDSKGIAEKAGVTALPDMIGGGPGDNDGPQLIGIGPGQLGGGGVGYGSGKGGQGTGQLAPFGVPGGGGGIGLKSRFLGTGGNARKIVFVCDASGSMLSVFDDLKLRLRESVEKLRPIQSFNVMFFQETTVAAVDRNGLMMATPDNKRKAFEFMDKMFVRSSTNPIPALEMAFQQKPELIYLLTDGDFEGPGNEVVVKYCQEKTKDGKTKINTIAFIPKDTQGIAQEREFVKALETIAKGSGGVFKHVNEEQMAERQ
ncbi:MAG: hypothetical protein NTU53_12890 [Planctomycetota bacterium]|nr:hypothetical protein [Planctomycetota bacterium]